MNDQQHPQASILVVDDNANNLHLLCDILTYAGYKVHLTSSGQQALESVRLAPPDLILLDIIMPDLSGYAVCQKLKADPRTRDIPIIFVSSLGDVPAKVRAFEAGGVDYVSRPLQRGEVLARVATHLKLRSLHQQLEAQYHQLQRETAERQQAQARIVAQQRQLATLAERKRIGHELHDNLAQAMAYIGAQVQLVRKWLQQDSHAPAEQALVKLAHVAAKAQNDVRRYLMGMQASADQARSESFHAMVEQGLAVIHELYDLKTHVYFPADLPAQPFAPEVATQLVCIIQEALTNVAQHAEVADARLTLRLDPDWGWLSIEDSGCGFEGAAPPPENDAPPLASGDPQPAFSLHFGLSVMRDRALAVGGALEVVSTPGIGTRVTVQMPRALDTPLDTGTALATTPADAASIRGLRVLLVDDHALLLTALHNMLQMRGVQVVGLATNGTEAQRLARERYPDIILMDIRMPDCDGLTATRRIKAELPDVKIIMLTMADDDETFWAALKAGASGYLVKDIEGPEFFERLVAAVRGEMVVSASLASRILEELTHQDDAAPPEALAPVEHAAPHQDLTARQLEVLRLVAQGLTYREVGLRLHITEDTVKYHMRHILEALHLDNYRAAAQYARQHGLLSS